MQEFKNYYFKESSTPLMSGISLPKDADGVVRNKKFIDCSFHPNCEDVRFKDCEFVVGTRTVTLAVALMY